MSDRQCSSCGGFCGRGGCEREMERLQELCRCAMQNHDAVVDSIHNMYRRKPLSYDEACTFIALHIRGGAESLEMLSQLVDLIRAIERAHGVGS